MTTPDDCGAVRYRAKARMVCRANAARCLTIAASTSMAKPCARDGVNRGMMRSNRGCHRGVVDYTRQVRISWKHLCLALWSGGSMLLAGCGGISASRTVSPLDFILPGILKVDPPPTNAPLAAIQAPVEIASAR